MLRCCNVLESISRTGVYLLEHNYQSYDLLEVGVPTVEISL